MARGESNADTRRFVLLQGPGGPFFSQLGAALTAAGHAVLRLVFNGGDRLFAGRGRRLDFRGQVDDWPAFIAACLQRERATDIVLFGDCRPLHRSAIAIARDLGLRVHVFEEGYLRPGWITLEADGVNAHSSLLRAGLTRLQNADLLAEPEPGHPVPMPFVRRAFEDVLYTAATVLGRSRYPGYRTHKPWSPLAEYRAGARRFFARPAFIARARRCADRLLAEGQPFFLFPLQLDSDAQIRVHSPFGSMRPAIEAVLASFARHAPAHSQLVISEHPLDQGVVDLQPVVGASASAAGLTGRVHYLQGGTPPGLVPACLGMVTVNSTMGLVALEARRPVFVLGAAVYRLPGLVHEGELDHFWCAPQAPDDALYAAFRRLLIARTQLRGGFHGPAARAVAITGALPRLLPQAAASAQSAEGSALMPPSP